jgi:aspartyl-tRNA(Asn)/glutamyl-tRNA(Gln) amidotransferase subunit A
MSEYADLSAFEIAAGFAAGKFSATEIAKSACDVVEKCEPKLHALLHFDRADVIARAKVVDAGRAAFSAKPLAGVPLVVKDNMQVRGLPLTCASKILGRYISPYTATAVARLEAAGAVVLGKSNLDEFAMGSSCEYSAFGPTMNPWDVTRVPGGSSGGSAASVAAGYAPLALGSDTGGSIRQPGALSGVVGASTRSALCRAMSQTPSFALPPCRATIRWTPPASRHRHMPAARRALRRSSASAWSRRSSSLASIPKSAPP